MRKAIVCCRNFPLFTSFLLLFFFLLKKIKIQLICEKHSLNQLPQKNKIFQQCLPNKHQQGWGKKINTCSQAILGKQRSSLESSFGAPIKAATAQTTLLTTTHGVPSSKEEILNKRKVKDCVPHRNAESICIFAEQQRLNQSVARSSPAAMFCCFQQ